MMAALSIALLAGTGILVVHLLWPVSFSDKTATFFKCMLGVGVGSGLGTLTLFICGLAFDGLAPRTCWIELALLFLIFVALLITAIRSGAVLQMNKPDHVPVRAFGWILAACCLAAALIDLWQFLELSALIPHGDWDAWAIWNVRARFLFRAESNWTEAFLVSKGHPDYPLLVPLSVARFWACLGNDTTLAPRILALVYLFATAGTFVGLLALLRGWKQAFLAGVVLLGSYALVDRGTWQNADLPLAYYYLAVCGVLCLSDRLAGSNRTCLVLAGVLAGLAAWTKNEGFLFCLLVFLLYPLSVLFSSGLRTAFRRAIFLLIGAIPVGCVVFYFKLVYAPPNDLFQDLAFTQVLDRLSHWHRYKTTGVEFWKHFSDLARGYIWVLPVYALLAGMRFKNNLRPGAVSAVLIVAMIAVGYFFIYIITSKNLSFHLMTSCSRLLLQVWPCVLFLFFMFAATPDESSRQPSFLVGRLAPFFSSSPDRADKQG